MDSSTDTTLSSGTASGTQATTQNPQTSSAASSLGGQSTNLQPGTATSLLTSSNGIVLQNNGVSTVSLTSTVAAQTTHTVQAQHHHHTFNPVLVAIPAILFIAAMVIFINTTRSAKTTTK